MQKSKTYIFGHQNPDTDSICSSIAYAYLKDELGSKNTKAYRLGKINRETQFVLDYFHAYEPPLLKDVRIQLKDLDLYTPKPLRKNDPIKEVWRALSQKKGARLIPIVDAEGMLEGVVTQGDLMNVFMESEKNILTNYEVLFSNMLEVLHGTLASGSYPYERVCGNLYISSARLDEKQITKQDVIVCNRFESANEHIQAGHCGCVILTDGVQVENRNESVAVICVKDTMLKVISVIRQAISTGSVMRTEGIINFSEENYIEDIIDTMQNSTYRNFPVVDRKGRFAGVISRRHLIRNVKKNVILIDHNEKKQSVEGLEEANILEIIDHHRVADVQTETPLYIRAEPVGCTATIVFKLYKENDVTIPKKMAGLLLSAILSDTLMFHSPTTTAEDKKTAEKLAKYAKVDLKDFGEEMFRAGTVMTDFTTEQILEMDRKRFVFGQYEAYISQINTLDFNTILDKREALLETMEQFRQLNNADFYLLLITHIMIGGSELLTASTDKADVVLEKALKINPKCPYSFLPGVVSRKKQVVPVLSSVCVNNR